MAKKKKNGNLLKNIAKAIGKTVDSLGNYLSKNPISFKGKTKNGKEVSSTIGGKVDKETEKFIKSGKKFRISTKNGKHTVFEV